MKGKKKIFDWITSIITQKKLKVNQQIKYKQKKNLNTRRIPTRKAHKLFKNRY